MRDELGVLLEDVLNLLLEVLEVILLHVKADLGTTAKGRTCSYVR